MLFGPAYKGITLASAMAVACAARGRNLPFAFNRKEAKDHGEGGVLVGAPLSGRVAIIDDVISAGTSVRESVDIIRAAGATPAAVFIAIDRMERGGNAEQVAALSAVEEVRQRYGLAVHALATLDDLLAACGGGSGGTAEKAVSSSPTPPGSTSSANAGAAAGASASSTTNVTIDSASTPAAPGSTGNDAGSVTPNPPATTPSPEQPVPLVGSQLNKMPHTQV